MTGINLLPPIAGYFIHNVRVKGLWLLFKDSARDRKDGESYPIEKPGSRKPGATNEKL